MFKKLFRISVVLLNLFLLSGWIVEAQAQSVTRLTTNTGPDFAAVWDPRGVNIAYLRLKSDTTSIYEAYQVQSSGQGGEQALLTGLVADFGVAVGLSWIGNTGFLAVEEAISGFEVLKFNTSMAPFDRTVANGADAANSLLLSVDGGGGQSLTRISRDGTTALIRFSTSGSGGVISIRSDLVSNMTGQLSSRFGSALLTVNAGSDPKFLNGGAISPNGSKFVLPIPIGSASTAHDLFIGDTVPASTTVNLTNSASGGVFNIYPDFSPDGQKIVFSRWSGLPNETYDLYMINIDGTGLTQITDTPNFSELYPSWSPDGTSIVFTGKHVAGHESEFPALEAGESANDNVYILTLPATNIVTPKTKLLEPPQVEVNDQSVTFTFTPFLKAQFSASTQSARILTSELPIAERRSMVQLRRSTKAKVSFKYDLQVTKDGGKKRDSISKTSKKNSLTIKKVPPGTYSAKYRVELTQKTNSKPTVVKRTKFSPPAKFTVS